MRGRGGSWLVSGLVHTRGGNVQSIYLRGRGGSWMVSGLMQARGGNHRCCSFPFQAAKLMPLSAQESAETQGFRIKQLAASSRGTSIMTPPAIFHCRASTSGRCDCCGSFSATTQAINKNGNQSGALESACRGFAFVNAHNDEQLLRFLASIFAHQIYASPHPDAAVTTLCCGHFERSKAAPRDQTSFY